MSFGSSKDDLEERQNEMLVRNTEKQQLQDRQIQSWVRNARELEKRVNKVREREKQLRDDIATYENYRHELVMELRLSVMKHQQSMRGFKTVEEWSGAAHSLLGIVEWLSNVL